MIYAKVKEGKIETFPYTISQLKKDNPNTSFPSIINDELLESFDVYPISQSIIPAFDKKTQRLTKDIGVVNGKWTQIWSVTVLPIDIAEKNVKDHRDQLLSETDWIVSKSYEQGIAVPLQWANYRQALRDITKQTGFPYQVIWPDKPK